MTNSIRIPAQLLQALLSTIRVRHPAKSFGYLLSSVDPTVPTDFLLFEENIRNDRAWREEFESYGDYFTMHRDAGFVATPGESWLQQKKIMDSGMFEVGVFHSHQRHPANFSRIDYEMHVARFETLWHMIISMRNPSFPVVRVFAPSKGMVRELPLEVLQEPTHLEACPDIAIGPRLHNAKLSELRSLLELDPMGRPKCNDAPLVLKAAHRVLRSRDAEAIESLLSHGFLRGAAERYSEFVSRDMRLLAPSAFAMGSDMARLRHFCGEAPQHMVLLTPFEINQYTVTNEIFGLFDDSRQNLSRGELRLPVTGVSWAQAALFAMWMGCRLPTEAEWEFACGAGSNGEWCCDDELRLEKYAWYCKNSEAAIHPVGTRAGNVLGLFDLHGNVWEWCQDDYDPDFYGRCARVDPISSLVARHNPGTSVPDKVTRGGSFQSLAEMCRTRYRFHEPAGLLAVDLGFRLARGSPPGSL